MKRALSVIAGLLIAGLPMAAAAKVRIVNSPATPADSRPNSDAVPDAYAVTGNFTRIVVMRVKSRADLLAGIEKLTRDQHIQNGVILSGIGSLRGYSVHQVNNRDFPTQNIFTEEPNTPCDLVGMNGYIVDGKVHAHMTLGTGAKAIAGHLEPGTEVFTYAIVTVGVLDTDLKGVDDKAYR